MPLPFKFRIKHFPELDSTNTYARSQATLDAKEGMVYVADHQTGGRGQFDRKWESAAGKNLLFSILIRPPVSPSHAPLITQLVSHSIARVLEKEYKIPCTLKRPNDILADGRKICGILVESSSSSPKKIDDVIIGAGLNVNEAPAHVVPKPVSMKEITGKEFSPREVLEKILRELEKDLSELYAHPV